MSHQRAFTLIELIISTALSLFIVGIAVGVFLAQQAAFANIDIATSAQASLRDAQMEMEPALRRLGLGIDPRYAIDISSYACTTAPCRDRVTAADELVFYARNPNYQWVESGQPGCTTAGGCFKGNAWAISSATVTNITIPAKAGDQFLKGQVLQAVCTGGSFSTMATVAATTPSAPVSTASTLTIPLVTAAAGNPYRENLLTSACLASPGAGLFLVDRSRYTVQTFNNTPYLMLDTGLDHNLNDRTPTEGDTDDLIPIAKGIEDLQIAYLYTPAGSLGFTAPDGNRNWIVGDQAGSFEQPNPLVTAPVYATTGIDPSRFNLHPANIRGVRVSLTARSLSTDRTQPASWQGDPLPLRENRNQQPASLGRFRRFTTSSTVGLRNMDARSLTIF